MRCDGADSSRASNWTMSKKDDAAAAAVLQYLVQQNRPYSAQDVFMNLHKEHSKAVVQKVIDQLVETKELREKVNGKQKCYVANQVRQFFFIQGTVTIRKTIICISFTGIFLKKI